MIDRKQIQKSIARFASISASAQLDEASRASSLRLERLLGQLAVGSTLEDKMRVVALGHNACAHPISAYTVVGVDGSQVYPDRSFVAGVCGLINIGGIELAYGAQTSSARFFAATSIVSKVDIERGLVFCPELFDVLRTLQELEVGFAQMLALKERGEASALLLLDGSMIPYGLMLKNTALQQYFAQCFLGLMQKFYEHTLPLAWYISAPQSHVLARLVGEDACSDAQLLTPFLEDGKTTPIFALAQQSLLGVACGREYALSFFYVDCGQEIVRIEGPAWVLQDVASRDFVLAVVKDQVVKGFGYPVALTEAHRQALISAKDRDFVLRQLEQEGSFLPGGAVKATRKQIIPA